MIEKILPPGSVLGVLGGGQLGAMFAHTARRMGYQVAVWDPDAQAPAHRMADHSFAVPFLDQAAREQFSALAQAITLEWENVPADLCEWLEQRRPLHPSSAVLRILQDRLKQKQFLADHCLPVPAFTTVESSRDVRQGIERLGIPAVCKTATTGYDGKGQWIVRATSDVAAVEQQLETGKSGHRWILEQFVEFERELSVLVVRDNGGIDRVYPVAENRHEQGILRKTVVPAPIPRHVAEKAVAIAREAVSVLKGDGVFCVELFQLHGENLLINEIAPRPHNSGHYTLDVCSVSQFEQQVRVTSGLPLGEVRLLSPAAMVNLIGEEVRTVLSPGGCDSLYHIPGALLHLYGKRVIRTGRKMGHVTFVADQPDRAAAVAERFIEDLQHHI